MILNSAKGSTRDVQWQSGAVASERPLPGYDKQHTADPQVGEENVHPNVSRQGVEEGKHTGIGAVGLPVQNADPQCHERLGEVYRFLPDVGDRERSNGQISFLCGNTEGERQREREKPLETKALPSPSKHAASSDRPPSWEPEVMVPRAGETPTECREQQQVFGKFTLLFIPTWGRPGLTQSRNTSAPPRLSPPT